MTVLDHGCPGKAGVCRRRGLRKRVAQGCPAGAGVCPALETGPPLRKYGISTPKGRPRMGGGLPRCSDLQNPQLRAPPHGRGSAGKDTRSPSAFSGAPAWTGVCQPHPPGRKRQVGRPRMDGGLPGDDHLVQAIAMVPPHGRGSAETQGAAGPPPGRRPRMDGGLPVHYPEGRRLVGVTPHGRGFAMFWAIRSDRLFGRPAWAGVCRLTPGLHTHCQWPPRMDGGLPRGRAVTIFRSPATPHGWGFARIGQKLINRSSGRPAWAGVRPSSFCTWNVARWLPGRGRGSP